MQQIVLHALLVGGGDVAGHGLGVERMGVDVHPGAGLDQVHPDQGEHQGDGGDDLEVDDGLDRHAADPRHVVHAGDAVHHGAEDHRADQHADQGDEGVAEGFHGGAGARREMAERDPRQHPDQHLEPQFSEKAEPPACHRCPLTARLARARHASPIASGPQHVLTSLALLGQRTCRI